MIPYDISRKTTLKQKGGHWLTRRLGADVDYKQVKELWEQWTCSETGFVVIMYKYVRGHQIVDFEW